MSMLGSKIDAATAVSWGLVNAVADKPSSLVRGLDVAKKLAAQSASLGAIKAAIRHGWTCGLEEQLEPERDLQPRLQALPDFAEAIHSLREGRPASFGPRPIPAAAGQKGTA
jgi:2-(1,2-epoxy-1,2-dihydrophenyl)acetyl-CoA isomerase